MVNSLFLVFVGVMAVTVSAVCFRFLRRRAAIAGAASMFAWLVYVGIISFEGVVAASATRPPGAVFLFLPIITFLAIVVARIGSTAVTRIALAIPVWILIGLQCFRVGVELFLHRLWQDGLVPRMLTFAGANVDIYVGATAPLIAYLTYRRRSIRRIALLWNGLGVLALGNVVVRAVLTSPGPFNIIHSEVSNRMIGTFPFTFVPGFFVPLAFSLHLLAIRSLTEAAVPRLTLT